MPIYELTTEPATLDEPPPEFQQLLAMIAGKQAEVDDFMRMTAGVLSPADFLSEDNVGRIMAAVG